jgi:hypothetical protein
MHRARLFLLCALILTLSSCASSRPAAVAFLPPKIDCAAFEAPAMAIPAEPGAGEKALPVWQLYAWHWQAYAEHVLGQRVTTAQCLHQARAQGLIK